MEIEKFFASKIIILHPTEDKILLVSRVIDGNVVFEPAGGRLDIDFDQNIAETFEECAIREAKEELNLDIKLGAYLGNYHFFWKCAPNTQAFTICNVYLAESLSDFKDINVVGDLESSPVYPEWVLCESILLGKIPFDDSCVGLQDIIYSVVKNTISESEIR